MHGADKLIIESFLLDKRFTDVCTPVLYETNFIQRYLAVIPTTSNFTTYDEAPI